METITALDPKIYSIEEYLAMEERSAEKHHFINGEIIIMPGGTYHHNLIIANIITALNIALEHTTEHYDVLNGDMKVFVPRLLSFLYPDALVICREPIFYENRKDVILNPLLIVGVLSPSTMEYNRGEKFYDYKRIESFKEYVLIEQKIPFVTSSFKTAEKTWTDIEAEGVSSSIYLQSINCTVDLKKIYKGVTF